MPTDRTRSAVHADHALITPESHVPIAIPGWRSDETVVMLSREMGAKFAQMAVTLGQDALVTALAEDEEYFLFMLSGTATLTLDGEAREFGTEHFAYLPPGGDWQLTDGNGPARVLLFVKRYEPAPGVAAPAPVVRPLAEVPGEPFLGDEAALLKVMLPDDDPAFDWGVNVFEFAPGGTLPQVESHFMEHGLYLIEGQGVYRLGDAWYTVEAGDAIWMSPYLLQWFAATGKTPSRYIYYKEMNRAPAI